MPWPRASGARSSSCNESVTGGRFTARPIDRMGGGPLSLFLRHSDLQGTANMHFRPLHDRVVVEALDAAQKVGSILLPDTAQEKPQEGKVVAVGPGQRNAKGALAAPFVKNGDRVI